VLFFRKKANKRQRQGCVLAFAVLFKASIELHRADGFVSLFA
jgi:hypothetical protein